MNFKRLLLSCLGVIAFVACDDIVEKDISGEQVVLLFPTENAVLNTGEVTFRWEEMKGGRQYRLSIASPTFEHPSQVYIDTTISNTSLTLPLQPGEYQWRVQALNAGYESLSTERVFTLDSTSNLSGARVVLLSPGAGSFTNSKVVRFSWEPVPQAEKYILAIRGGITVDTVVYATGVNKHLPDGDKNYRWQVTALNATGLVSSISRTFSTDFTSPGTPVLLHPQPDTAVFSWPVKLAWQRAATDVARDSLFLYLSDQRRLFPGFPQAVTSSTFKLTSGLTLVPGEYFWTVKSFDRAGNASTGSVNRKIIVR